MTRNSLGAIFAVSALAFACSDYATRQPSTVTSPDPVAASAGSGNAASGTMAATPQSATMQFGLEDVGGSKPPGHPSDHSNDTLVPGTVVIDKGGTVTFNAVGIHQIAIYEPGKNPEDVDSGNTVAMPSGCPSFLPAFLIDDPVGRLVINGLNPEGCGPRTYTHTFADAGKYLVICAVQPHFLIKMYGWVTVRDS
jgi:plastocyanin